MGEDINCRYVDEERMREDINCRYVDEERMTVG